MKKFKLPGDYRPYTDKYFLRSRTILEKEGLDPIVKLKVFTRKGNTFSGGEEAAHFLYETLKSEDPDAHLYVLPEGAKYKSKEPLMIVEGRAQKVVDKETVYLGILSGALSRAHGIKQPTYKDVYNRAKELVGILKDIPATYFGARHYHWSLDEMIARAALDGGFKAASSDIGAATHGIKGVGTIPHFLILIMGYYHRTDYGTVQAAKAFDKHMPKEIPRIVLIDTFNREITDSLATAEALEGRLSAVRIDTCGENIPEGGTPYTLNKKGKDPSFMIGRGVTIESAQNLRKAFDNSIHGYVNPFLSSGFGNPKKTAAFMKAYDEWMKEYNEQLFIGAGIGELYPAIFTTADIFEINGTRLAKTGREVDYVDYSRFKKVF